jgi:transcriptional regulator with XRE-family HTH domain
MPGDPGPMARRRQLGSILKQYRLDADMSIREVADQLLCSPSKISRIETAQRNVLLRDVRDLCNVYGLTDNAIREKLMRLARESRESAWWQEYDISPTLLRYVGLEGSASQISDYQLGTIPGLLQTQDYARAVLEAWVTDPAALKQGVDVRMARQQFLSDNLDLRAVIDESAVRRMVGGANVMRGQLDRLIELTGNSRVDLRVIPFTVGAHQGMVSGFTVLRFAMSMPSDEVSTMSDVVFLEGIADGIYLEQPNDVEQYMRAFERLQSIALKPASTAKLLGMVRRGL